MNAQDFIRHRAPFLTGLSEWHAALPQPDLESVVGDPARTAILSIDVINAFCYTGPLASPRVQRIVHPIVRLMAAPSFPPVGRRMAAASPAGVRHFTPIQEDHDPQAVEFEAYPPHGIHGTEDAEAVPEYKALPFWNEFSVMRKNSISAALGTPLDAWLEAHPEGSTFIVVGDCPDLCTSQLAMHLRLCANAIQKRGVRVIVPGDCTDTFDTPIELGKQIGAIPH